MSDDGNSLVACIPRLRRYARALLGDKASADSLVQDTMAHGWRTRPNWRQDGDLRIWLFSRLHHLYAERVHQASDEQGVGAGAPETGLTAGRADHPDMQAALQLLPTEQRAALLLVSLEQLSYDEVAEVLQIPLGAVLSRLSRARERLRLLMLGQAPVPPLKVVK